MLLVVAKFGPWASARADLHLPLKRIVETDIVRHVLVLRIAVFAIQLVRVLLLHEQNQVWIVRPFNDASEVHGVVNFVFGSKYFFEAEVVMACFQRIEGYLLVVPAERLRVLALADARKTGNLGLRHRVGNLGGLHI